ncbi:MAG: recombinase family protein [Prevotella sp.]|nr:recombinase family protein [Prevotella sp.]
MSNYQFYVDDGISGTTFEREGFQKMISDIEAGKVGTVIVKDMSRFGRDYLKVGYYTEVMFAEYDIHFIAINDGVDSEREDNDFTPIRNLFNEFYAILISNKKRTKNQAKIYVYDFCADFLFTFLLEIRIKIQAKKYAPCGKRKALRENELQPYLFTVTKKTPTIQST